MRRRACRASLPTSASWNRSSSSAGAALAEPPDPKTPGRASPPATQNPSPIAPPSVPPNLDPRPPRPQGSVGTSHLTRGGTAARSRRHALATCQDQWLAGLHPLVPEAPNAAVNGAETLPVKG